MDKLRAYLNTLTIAEQTSFAHRCNTTIGYLRKACSARQVLREKLCAAIEKQSGHVVKRQALRPEDFADIWPELATQAAAADVTPAQPAAPDAAMAAAAQAGFIERRNPALLPADRQEARQSVLAGQEN